MLVAVVQVLTLFVALTRGQLTQMLSGDGVGMAGMTSGRAGQPADNQICLVVSPDIEQCYRSFQGKPISDTAAQIACLRKLLQNFRPDRNATLDDKTLIRSLAGLSADGGSFGGSMGPSGPSMPASGFRIRREYRTLSREERRRLHRALNRLHDDGTVRAFARLHSEAFPTIHRGASFLPWHRVFLAFFEEALRRYDPTVSLAYWDSTMDYDMPNPVLSRVWTAPYFGNGLGEVTSGMCANWVTDNGRLQRNYGNPNSRLASKADMRMVLRNCYLGNISRPMGEEDNQLERYHDGPHVFVGGDMASAASPFDALFFLHHAFVDYVWEVFRYRQRMRCGVDPTRDYPEDITPGHAANDVMAGFEWLRNIDGCADYWTRYWYNYERTPTCPFCGYSPLLYCSRRRRTCVPKRRRVVPIARPGASRSASSLNAAGGMFNREQEAQAANMSPQRETPVFQGPLNSGRIRQTWAQDLATAEANGLTEETDSTANAAPATTGFAGMSSGAAGGLGRGIGGRMGRGMSGGTGSALSGSEFFPGGEAGTGSVGVGTGFFPRGGARRPRGRGFSMPRTPSAFSAGRGRGLRSRSPIGFSSF